MTARSAAAARSVQPRNWELRVGLPLDSWFEHRHRVTRRLAELGAVDGELTWGHYRGRVHHGSPAARMQHVDHTWLLLATGVVVDVVRWAVEGGPPRFFAGTTEGYDTGAQAWASMQPGRPPGWLPSFRPVDVELGDSRAPLLLLLGSPPVLCLEHLAWVGKQPPDRLGEMAGDVYESLISSGFEHLLDSEKAMQLLEGNLEKEKKHELDDL